MRGLMERLFRSRAIRLALSLVLMASLVGCSTKEEISRGGSGEVTATDSGSLEIAGGHADVMLQGKGVLRSVDAEDAVCSIEDLKTGEIEIEKRTLADFGVSAVVKTDRTVEAHALVQRTEQLRKDRAPLFHLILVEQIVLLVQRMRLFLDRHTPVLAGEKHFAIVVVKHSRPPMVPNGFSL